MRAATQEALHGHRCSVSETGDPEQFCRLSIHQQQVCEVRQHTLALPDFGLHAWCSF
jgi:hypothetical protein